MSRLPVAGSDIGTWGNVLNDYLGVSHNSDGTLRGAAVNPIVTPPYNVVGAGDGVTNDSAPISSAFATAASSSVAPAILGGSRRGTKIIQLPAGTFRVTSAEALMSDLGIAKTWGLTIRGAGRHMTHIVFEPGSAGQYLMYNNDDWLHVTFEDLTFHGSTAGGFTGSFMRSVSAGNAQNYVFNRVNWTGVWTYGIDLQGTNNNSEMSWFHCGIYDDWTAYLYSSSSVAAGGDNFLNYNFFACQVEYRIGNFVDLYVGGNINMWGGSLIHTGTSASAQTFFNFPKGDHAPGAERLLVSGVRVEHRHTASKLINSAWKRGIITFLACSFDNQNASFAGSDTMITAKFTVDGGAGNNNMSLIEWIGCSLQGKHQYEFEVDSNLRRRRIVYRDCEIASWSSAHDFIDIVNIGATTNLGFAPWVLFENCRSGVSTSGQIAYPFDCTVNWQASIGGQPKQYQVSAKKAVGGLPVQADAAVDVWLPLNAVITGVRFYMPATGASTSTTWAYTLATSEGSPTTIATAAAGTQWLNGFNINVDTWFMCDSDAKRHITLAAANITEQSASAICLITYLA